jgi:hypothetical protein
MEGLFGQAKSQHGLDRSRMRGLVKMHIQGLLTAMVLNVKKLLQSVSGRGAAVCYIGYCAMKIFLDFCCGVYLFFVGESFCLEKKHDIVLVRTK